MSAERKAGTHPARVWLFVCAATACAALLGAATWLRWGGPSWPQVALFWALHAITLIDRIEVPVERLSLAGDREPRGVGLSPGFVVLMTAVFATSPSTAVAVAIIPAVSALVDRHERDPLKLLFNSAQEAIYVGLAAVVFSAISNLETQIVSSFVAAALAAVVALALNTLLVAGVVAADRGIALRDVLRRMTWTIPHSIAFGLIALMIATLYRDQGFMAAVFLVMPLAALRVARQAKIQLDTTRERVLTEFVRAVEAKDRYTFRHSERVAAICVELHRELGAKAPDLERRWTAALLHDVGKVAIPRQILMKQSSLSADEYDVIKQHPQVGAEAVRQIELFGDLVDEVLYHHERIDGRGYPTGLSGDSIPINARILAVADAFEALTSERPYRRAMTPDAALTLIRETAGTHHDPGAVAALERMLARGVTFVRPATAEARDDPQRMAQ